jgi:hypothetical protein
MTTLQIIWLIYTILITLGFIFFFITIRSLLKNYQRVLKEITLLQKEHKQGIFHTILEGIGDLIIGNTKTRKELSEFLKHFYK